jgi:nucleoside-diphosphate-sugar epimerase
MISAPLGFDESLPNTVVIVGATGFIGQNLVRELKGKIDRIIPVSRSGVSVAGLTGRDLRSLREVDLGRDAILVDLAAYRYDALNFEKAQAAILIENVRMLCDIYEFCAAKNICEVRRASSVAVYPAGTDILDDGLPLDLPENPHDGEFMYAWSKRIGEIYADSFRRKLGINTLNFRLTNPYGPYDSIDEVKSHVVPAFILRGLRNEGPFTIHGNPDASRDFIFVKGVCRVFEKSLNCRETGGSYNLGSGRNTTIFELAQTVLGLLGRSEEIQVHGGAASGVMHRRCNIERLRQDFAIPQFASLPAGLETTIQWYRSPVWS